MHSSKNYRAYLIAHTHWDREWYHSMELYRFRLIEVVERLKNILAGEACQHSFFFDGQTIPFEEYLEVRPEDESFFAEQIRAEKLHIGPFYLLLDEQLVNGESYLRNLMTGLATVKRYGGKATVGYMPDNFGHISQTPQILAGFGIDNIVMWRGFDIDTNTPTETWWQGADGTRIKAVLLLCSYSSAAGADPANPESFNRAFASIKTLKEHAPDDTILLLHGIDHSFPHPDMPQIAAILNSADNEVEVKLADFSSYLNAVSWDKLPCLLHGELIKSIHMDGTFSSRLRLKKLNRMCETRLIAHAEPLATLAWLNGAPYPADDMQRAWKKLLQSHPHDSITGCHADRVAQDMETRLATAAEMADYLRCYGFDCLAGEKSDYRNPANARVIAVFNPLPTSCSKVIRTEIFLPNECDANKVFISDEDRLLRADIITIEKSCFPQRSDYMIPQNIPLKRLIIEFGPVNLAPFSITNFSYKVNDYPRSGDNLIELVNSARDSNSNTVRKKIHQTGTTLENSYYQVTVNADATVDVIEKAGGKEYKNLHAIEAEMDAGNLYNFAPLPARTKYYFSPTSTVLLENFSHSASIQITGHLRLPAGLTTEVKPRPDTVTCPIEVKITLKEDDPVIYFSTRFTNHAKNIIIRTVFNTALKNAVNHTHTPFDIVTREPLSKDYALSDGRVFFSSLSRYCAQYFTSVNDDKDGFTLLNRGLPEYTFHANGRLSLTLLRSTNLIWRYDKDNFPRHFYPAESGFDIGPHECEYGIMLHARDIVSSGMLLHAVAYNQIPYIRLSSQPISSPFSMRLLPETMLLSACKRAEDGTGIIVRFYNPTATPQPAQLHLTGNIQQVFKCRLDETQLEDVPFTAGCLTVTAGAKEIITLKIIVTEAEKQSATCTPALTKKDNDG